MIEDLTALLRGGGLRVTRPRLAVLETLGERPHSETREIIDHVRARHTAISHQAVYDCLATFHQVGLVRRIQPAGAVARYELVRGDNHHHVVCTSCGAMADVACAVGEAPCLDATGADGFAITQAEVIFWGRCAPCQPIHDTSHIESHEKREGTP